MNRILTILITSLLFSLTIQAITTPLHFKTGSKLHYPTVAQFCLQCLNQTCIDAYSANYSNGGIITAATANIPTVIGCFLKNCLDGANFNLAACTACQPANPSPCINQQCFQTFCIPANRPGVGF